MEYVVIGKIVNTFGIKGELKVESHTDFLSERFKKDSTIYIGENHEALKVASYRMHKVFVMLSLVGLDNINLVLKYKDMYIYKSCDDIKPLGDGEYYFKDLINLDVYLDDKQVGKCINVEEGKAYNFLRIKKDDDKECLVPNLPVFIKNVDLANSRINLIDKASGLL